MNFRLVYRTPENKEYTNIITGAPSLEEARRMVDAVLTVSTIVSLEPDIDAVPQHHTVSYRIWHAAEKRNGR